MTYFSAPYWSQAYQHTILTLQTGQIQEWGAWSYLLLALLVAVEGPIATLLGAAAASAGVMKPWLVFLFASAGNLTADFLWYSIGYLGKIEWLYRLGQRVGIDRKHIEQLQKSLHDHAFKFLFFAKLSMSMMVPSLVAAGLARVRWRSWFPAIFGAEMIWTGSLVLIGYYSTEAIKQVEHGLQLFLPAAALVFIVLVLLASKHLLKENETKAS